MNNKVIQIILALLLPPLAVAIVKGINKDFVINILLTIVFFFPGVVHALWVVMNNNQKAV